MQLPSVSMCSLAVVEVAMKGLGRGEGATNFWLSFSKSHS